MDVRRGRGIQLPQLAANLAGVGVAQVVEDGQGLLPGLAGGVVLPGGVLGVAEVGESAGLADPVAEFGQQFNGVTVAADRLCVLAEVMVSVTEAVPGGRLAVAVAEFTVQGESLTTALQGQLVVTEQSVMPAGGVKGQGHAAALADGLEQDQGPLVVHERLGVAALLVRHPAEGLVGAGLASAVLELPVQVDALGQVLVSLVVVAEPGAVVGDQAPDCSLPGLVAEA